MFLWRTRIVGAVKHTACTHGAPYDRTDHRPAIQPVSARPQQATPTPRKNTLKALLRVACGQLAHP
jgi:hypothetical protein